MTYKSRITSSSLLWVLLILIFITLLTFTSVLQGRLLPVVLFVCISIAVWYSTFVFPKYHIQEGKLRRSTIGGQITIDISTIRKIETQTHFLGMGILKPIQKGLLIHYGRFEDVFVNPENKEDFVNQLTNINPDIEVLLKDK